MLQPTTLPSPLLGEQRFILSEGRGFESCTLPVIGGEIIEALRKDIAHSFRYEDGLHSAPGNIILIRHGTYEGADPDLVVGVSDPCLNRDGRESARLAGYQLYNQCLESKFDSLKVFCSPLGRAKETAQIISHVIADYGIASELIEDQRLQAQNFGSFENKRFAELEISEESVHLYDRVRPELRPYVRTGSTPEDLGESSFQVALRVADFFQATLQEEIITNHCLIVTHGSVLKTIKGLASNTPIESWDNLKLAHGSFATLVPR